MAKTFGTHLRALRLGFSEVGGVGYVRVRAGGPPWVIDVWPFDCKVPAARCSGGERVCWWEGEDVVSPLVRLYAAGRPLDKPFILRVDDDGNLLPDEPAKE